MKPMRAGDGKQGIKFAWPNRYSIHCYVCLCVRMYVVSLFSSVQVPLFMKPYRESLYAIESLWCSMSYMYLKNSDIMLNSSLSSTTDTVLLSYTTT